jgi:hypothetical protein
MGHHGPAAELHQLLRPGELRTLSDAARQYDRDILSRHVVVSRFSHEERRTWA